MAYAYGHPKHVPAGASRNIPIAHARQCAVLVIDVQKYFGVPGSGYFVGVQRNDQPYYFNSIDNMVPNIQKLLTAARQNESDVIYTYVESLTKDNRDASLDYKLSGPVCVPKGSEGAEMLDGITPEEDDILIPKTSCSVFQSTNIDYVLRNMGIRYLVICGQLTNQCVESAVRDAADRGYLVTVVGDACAAKSAQEHESGLSSMKGFARMASVDAVISELEKGADNSPGSTSKGSSMAMMQKGMTMQKGAKGKGKGKGKGATKTLQESSSSANKVVHINLPNLIASSEVQSQLHTVPSAAFSVSTDSSMPGYLEKSTTNVSADGPIERARASDSLQMNVGSLTNILSRQSLLHSTLTALKAAGVRSLRFTTVCSSAQIRSKTMNLACATPDSLALGVGFVECLMGMGAMGDHIAPNAGLGPAPSLNMCPDFDSLHILPYQPTHANVYGYLCDNIDDQIYSPEALFAAGRRHVAAVDPRGCLKKSVDHLGRLGVKLHCGVEIEFVLYDQNGCPVDKGNFAAAKAMDTPGVQEFLGETEEFLEKQGVQVELIHRESCHGQFEIVLHYVEFNPIKMADAVLTTKQTLHAVANRHNLKVSFVPKPSAHEAGSGMHVHFSVHKGSEKKSNDELKKKFMAGILQHLSACIAITTPTDNSFRRIAPGCWAGAYNCWGTDNKEAALRDCGSHFEVKTVDNSCNPYLALAALITAGADGVENNFILPDAVQGDPAKHPSKPVHLPTGLTFALESLEHDKVILRALGQRLSKAYLAVKWAETKHFVEKGLEEEIKILENVL